LDWGLPDTTGIDVIRQLRASGVDVPIIMLTGRTEESDVEMGLRAGADDYLTKPVTPRALAARLAAHLRRAARDAGAADREEVKTNASVLAQVSIFFLAPAASLRALAGSATRLSVKAGQTVIADGAANETLYVIIKGH